MLDGDAVFGCNNPDLAFEDLQPRLGDGRRALRNGEDIRWPCQHACVSAGRARGSRRGCLGGQRSPDQCPQIGRSPPLPHVVPAWAPPTWAGARPPRYVMALVRLAHFASDTQQAILAGGQTQAVTVKGLLEAEVPLAGAAQRDWWASLTALTYSVNWALNGMSLAHGQKLG